MKRLYLKVRDWHAAQSPLARDLLWALAVVLLFSLLCGCASDPFDSLKKQRDGNTNQYCKDNAECSAATHHHYGGIALRGGAAGGVGGKVVVPNLGALPQGSGWGALYNRCLLAHTPPYPETGTALQQQWWDVRRVVVDECAEYAEKHQR